MARAGDNLERLALTRHIVYSLVTLAIVIPLASGVPISFETTTRSQDLYQFIEDLPPGAHVLMSFDYAPDAQAELLPMSIALLRHCFERDLVPIVMTHWVDGVGLCKQACDQVARETGAVAGKDYALLGYRPGMANLIMNMGENLKSAFPKDTFGQPTATMAALEGVDSLRDMDLVIDLAAGPTVEMWIIYGADYGFDMAACTTAVIAPSLYPWLDSGQLVALSGGMRATADYEQLIARPGTAIDSMHAITATHILLIVLLVGANVGFILKRVRGTERT